MSRLPVEKDGVVTGLKDTKETFELHKLMLVMPKLMSTLHGVHNQHPTFSCACRLAKRWLASQMLFDDFYLDEMALQIIVASLYINPAPYEAPSSPFVGFLRFLHLMATYDWAAHPLIVNFNNDLNAEDYKEIRTKFCKDRSTLPVMFLSTSLDKFSEYFTKRHPTTHILSRIATLAQESLSILQNQLDDFGQNLDAKAIFKPHTEVFDAVIHVNPEASGRSQLAVDFGSGKAFPKYSAIKPEDKIPVFDYDLILEFLQRLREQFHEFALFFYDIFGGRYIGVVWKPNAFQPLPITSACVAYRTVIVNSNEEVQLIPNVDCILKEFENWSPKLIKSVEIRRTSPAGLQATASQSQDS